MNSKKNYLPLILGIVVAGVWTAAVLLLFSWIWIYPNFIAGLAFGLGFFVLTILYQLRMASAAAHADRELSAAHFPLTILFWILSMILNTVFMYRMRPTLNKLFLLLDIALIAIYLIILLAFGSHAAATSERTAHIASKTADFSRISGNVGNLLSMTDDPRIRKELLNLKQTVDYSTNTSVPAALDYENYFLTQLSRIRDLLSRNAAAEEVLPLIQEAASTWRSRNSIQQELR